MPGFAPFNLYTSLRRRTYIFATSASSTAGNFLQWMLANPASSSKVIEFLYLQMSMSQGFNLFLVNTGSIGGLTQRNTGSCGKHPAAPLQQLVIGTGQGGSGIPNLAQTLSVGSPLALNNLAFLESYDPIVLPPGTGLLAMDAQSASADSGSLVAHWREL